MCHTRMAYVGIIFHSCLESVALFTEGKYGLGMKAPCRPSVRFFTIHLTQPLFSIFLLAMFLIPCVMLLHV